MRSEAPLTKEIWFRGKLRLDELPGLIRSQVGYAVLQEGDEWTLVDTASGFVPELRRSGSGAPIEMVDKTSASDSRDMDKFMSMVQNVTVKLFIVDASVQLTLPHPQISMDGAVGEFGTVVCDGSDFSLKDDEERQLPITTTVTVGGTSQLQSGYAQLSAGVIFSGHVRTVGARMYVTGSIEISQFQGGGNSKTTRSVTVNQFIRRGEWCEVSQIDRGELSATLLRSWGLSASAARLRMFLVVE